MKINSLIKWTVITLITLPLISLAGFLLWFEGDYYRAHLERLVTDNTPLALKINAPIEYSLSDPYLITLRALEFSFESKPILTLDRFALRIDELSLLRREVIIDGMSIDRPNVNMGPIQVERLLEAFAEDEAPNLSNEPKEELLLPLSSLSLRQLNIDGLSLRWEDLQQPIRLKELTLAITDWQLIEQSKLQPSNWQLAIYLFTEELTWQHITAEDFTLNGLMSEDKFTITDASIQIFNGAATLAASIDLDTELAATINNFTAQKMILDDALFSPFLSTTADTSTETPVNTVSAELVPTLSLPFSSFHIDAFSIKELSLSSDTVIPELQLNNLSLSGKEIVLVDDHTFAANKLSGSVQAQLEQLQLQQHQLDNFSAELELNSGSLSFHNLKTELLGGSLYLEAKTQLTDHLQTEIVQLQLKDLQISDSLWVNDKASPPAIAETTVPDPEAPRTKLPIKGLVLRELSIENMQLALTSMAPSVTAESLNATLSDLVLVKEFTAASYPAVLAQDFSLSFAGKNIKASDRNIDSAVLDVNGGQPFKVAKLEVNSTQGKLAGQGTIATQDNTLPFELTLAGKAVELSLLDPLDTGYPLSGQAQFDASLTGSATSTDALISSITGPIHLRTERIKMYNIDVDTTLDGFLDSQELTLIDVGAFALLGPIGLAVSKAKAVSSAAAGALAGGETQIAQIDININFDRGVMNFGPSAIATEKHRFALFGDINLPQQRFDLLRTTVLDDEACVRLARSIDGPFDSPDVQVASAITGTVTGLFSGAFSGTEKYFGDGCEPVYAGPVKAPHPFDFDANTEKLEEQKSALLQTLPDAAHAAELEMRRAQFDIYQQEKQKSGAAGG